MFHVFSKKTIANTLLVLLTIIIVTISGITLTNVIKNNLQKNNAPQPAKDSTVQSV